PQVRITEPAKDVTLPADGHLKLRGESSDDIGLNRLALRLRLAGSKTVLRDRPYLADKLGQPGFGTPRKLENEHVLELPTLLNDKGQRVELKPGMQIEYFLEAADACDFHEPNVTRSEPTYRITIAEGKETAQQKKDREAARKEQQQREKEQAEKAQ